MAEPEEESDEEWQKIAEVVNIVEQQVILARAQTAAGHGGGRGLAAPQQRLQVASPPPPPPPPHQRQVQLQRMQQEQASPAVHQLRYVHASPPTVQPQQVQLRAQPAQLQVSGAHNATTSPPPPHTVRRHIPPLHQARAALGTNTQVTSALPPLGPPAPAPPPAPAVDTESHGDSATAASLRAENARLHSEYRTRIRHLEAQLQKTRSHGELRSRLALAEREIRTLRGPGGRARGGGTQVTQGGEVVEATQTGLEVLKASLAAETGAGAEAEAGAEMLGCGGLDGRVQGALLRRELFQIAGYERLPGVSLRTGREDWTGLTEVLVGLVGGEGWRCALEGLEVVLRVREARYRMIGMEGVKEVVECVYGHEVGYGVLEMMVMGCAEVGEGGDAVRRLVLGDERLAKTFRGGGAADGVVRMGVTAVLECDDGRVDDGEWGAVEGAIGECCKRVATGVRMDVLGTACVLAAEVVMRHGGVEGLLDFVCARSVTGDDDGLARALDMLATLLEEARAGVGKVELKGGVRVVGLAGLLQLAKREGVVARLACRIVDGLYTLEKRTL